MGNTKSFIAQLYDSTVGVAERLDNMPNGIPIGTYRIGLADNSLHAYPKNDGCWLDNGLVTPEKLQEFYQLLRGIGFKTYEIPHKTMERYVGDYVGLQLGNELYMTKDRVSDGDLSTVFDNSKFKRYEDLSPLERLKIAGHEAGHGFVEIGENLGMYKINDPREHELAAQRMAINIFAPDGIFPNQPAYKDSVRMYETMNHAFSKN